jgi:hypothetical protein
MFYIGVEICLYGTWEWGAEKKKRVEKINKHPISLILLFIIYY